ncbi:unnamed protein product [Phytophthora fragariaefolia]|uniref:Unnamed protein product n=1 Tax=Phytophthora fragariaefolia TaxID=1490495 RepID=A0A9W7CZ70_9STRA|nr:unnamed protein product [Phytophthora fragariaefolia]
MDAELLSNERNGTWTLVPRGTANRTFGRRWIFAKKRDQFRRVVCYKARLVAKGFKQKYGINVFETYSPVANVNSIRVNAYDYECQLNKAIYGLKQAASAWNKAIHRVFLMNEFKSCGADQCVYVKRSENGFIYVCLYVDAMIIAAKPKEETGGGKEALKNIFKMKELGPTKFIL